MEILIYYVIPAISPPGLTTWNTWFPGIIKKQNWTKIHYTTINQGVKTYNLLPSFIRSIEVDITYCILKIQHKMHCTNTVYGQQPYPYPVVQDIWESQDISGLSLGPHLYILYVALNPEKCSVYITQWLHLTTSMWKRWDWELHNVVTTYRASWWTGMLLNVLITVWFTSSDDWPQLYSINNYWRYIIKFCKPATSLLMVS